jgi:hypothetical protein
MCDVVQCVCMASHPSFFTSPILIRSQRYNEDDTGNKRFYLAALAHLLLGIPKQILLAHLPTIFPMLLEVRSSFASCDFTAVSLVVRGFMIAFEQYYPRVH